MNKNVNKCVCCGVHCAYACAHVCVKAQAMKTVMAARGRVLHKVGGLHMEEPYTMNTRKEKDLGEREKQLNSIHWLSSQCRCTRTGVHRDSLHAARSTRHTTTTTPQNGSIAVGWVSSKSGWERGKRNLQRRARQHDRPWNCYWKRQQRLQSDHDTRRALTRSAGSHRLRDV